MTKSETTADFLSTLNAAYPVCESKSLEIERLLIRLEARERCRKQDAKAA